MRPFCLVIALASFTLFAQASGAQQPDPAWVLSPPALATLIAADYPSLPGVLSNGRELGVVGGMIGAKRRVSWVATLRIEEGEGDDRLSRNEGTFRLVTKAEQVAIAPVTIDGIPHSCMTVQLIVYPKNQEPNAGLLALRLGETFRFSADIVGVMGGMWNKSTACLIARIYLENAEQAASR